MKTQFGFSFSSKQSTGELSTNSFDSIISHDVWLFVGFPIESHKKNCSIVSVKASNLRCGRSVKWNASQSSLSDDCSYWYNFFFYFGEFEYRTFRTYHCIDFNTSQHVSNEMICGSVTHPAIVARSFGYTWPIFLFSLLCY